MSEGDLALIKATYTSEQPQRTTGRNSIETIDWRRRSGYFKLRSFTDQRDPCLFK
jgi:hypothetical protein